MKLFTHILRTKIICLNYILHYKIAEIPLFLSMSHGGNIRTIDLLFFEFLRISSSIQHLIKMAKMIVRKTKERLKAIFNVLILSNNY